MNTDSTRTHSMKGSPHWRRTLLGRIKRVGESLAKGRNDEKLLKAWGKLILEDTKEMIEYFDQKDAERPVIPF